MKLLAEYEDQYGSWEWVSTDFIKDFNEWYERYEDDFEKSSDEILKELVDDTDGDPYEFWDYFYNNTDYQLYNWECVSRPEINTMPTELDNEISVNYTIIEDY